MICMIITTEKTSDNTHLSIAFYLIACRILWLKPADFLFHMLLVILFVRGRLLRRTVSKVDGYDTGYPK